MASGNGTHLADPRNSRAVLIGVHKFDHLINLPAVSANLAALRRRLIDPNLWGLPPENCFSLPQPQSPDQVLDKIEWAAKAVDTLLVYYAGHGLIGGRDDELLLSLPKSRQFRIATTLPYDWLADEIRYSDARCKVVILDCCYSGRALQAKMGEESLSGKTPISGAFVMASSAATKESNSEGDGQYTAFTGELLRVLDQGIPGTHAELNMLKVFQHVRTRLRAAGLPAPEQCNKELGAEITLFRNRSYVAAEGSVEHVAMDAVSPQRLPAVTLHAAPDPFEGWQINDPTSEWAWRTEAFRWGPFWTPVIIVEGDGANVVAEDSVRVIVDRQKMDLPPELESWKEEVEADQEARRRRGDSHFWNGKSYAIDKVTISRKIDTEEPIVFLRLRHCDYYTFLATQQFDRAFPDGTTLRSRYLDERDPFSVPAFMSSSLGTNIAVITADQQLIFSRRSRTVGSHPGYWNSSANEALSRDIDSAGRNSPNLYDVARRGLREELTLEAGEYRLDMLALTVDHRNQWGALFVAELLSVTGQEFLARRSRGVADKFEHDGHHLEPFDTYSVVKFMFAPERRDLWAPTAPALFFLTLVSRFGRLSVEQDSKDAFLSLREQER